MNKKHKILIIEDKEKCFKLGAVEYLVKSDEILTSVIGKVKQYIK